jgi:hypothetical protein
MSKGTANEYMHNERVKEKQIVESCLFVRKSQVKSKKIHRDRYVNDYEKRSGSE